MRRMSRLLRKRLLTMHHMRITSTRGVHALPTESDPEWLTGLGLCRVLTVSSSLMEFT